MSSFVDRSRSLVREPYWFCLPWQCRPMRLEEDDDDDLETGQSRPFGEGGDEEQSKGKREKGRRRRRILNSVLFVRSMILGLALLFVCLLVAIVLLFIQVYGPNDCSSSSSSASTSQVAQIAAASIQGSLQRVCNAAVLEASLLSSPLINGSQESFPYMSSMASHLPVSILASMPSLSSAAFCWRTGLFFGVTRSFGSSYARNQTALLPPWFLISIFQNQTLTSKNPSIAAASASTDAGFEQQPLATTFMQPIAVSNSNLSSLPAVPFAPSTTWQADGLLSIADKLTFGEAAAVVGRDLSWQQQEQEQEQEQQHQQRRQQLGGGQAFIALSPMPETTRVTSDAAGVASVAASLDEMAIAAVNGSTCQIGSSLMILSSNGSVLVSLTCQSDYVGASGSGDETDSSKGGGGQWLFATSSNSSGGSGSSEGSAAAIASSVQEAVAVNPATGSSISSLKVDGQEEEVGWQTIQACNVSMTVVFSSPSLPPPHHRNLWLLYLLVLPAFGIVLIATLLAATLFSRKELERRLQADIDEQMELTRKAELRSHTKSAFLASMSHELRTPMAAILGLLDLVLCEDLLPEVMVSVQQIKLAATALLGLLNQILDLSKVEAGKLVLESRDFDVRKELELLVEIFSVQALSKGTELALELPEEMTSMVRGDPARIRQVFNNLLSNSIKFTPKGQIVIRGFQRPVPMKRSPSHGALGNSEGGAGDSAVSLPENWHQKADLVFEIEDTGIGIPKEKRDTVFEAYGQADVAHGQVGTGLGLAIVRSLVEMMGGKICVAEKATPGTLFRFSFLLEKSEVVTNKQQQEEEEKKNETWRLDAPLMRALWDGNVVLVMSGSIIRQAVAKWLRKRGLLVAEVDQWEALMERLRQVAEAAEEKAKSAEVAAAERLRFAEEQMLLLHGIHTAASQQQAAPRSPDLFGSANRSEDVNENHNDGVEDGGRSQKAGEAASTAATVGHLNLTPPRRSWWGGGGLSRQGSDVSEQMGGTKKAVAAAADGPDVLNLESFKKGIQSLGLKGAAGVFPTSESLGSALTDRERERKSDSPPFKAGGGLRRGRSGEKGLVNGLWRASDGKGQELNKSGSAGDVREGSGGATGLSGLGPGLSRQESIQSLLDSQGGVTEASPRKQAQQGVERGGGLERGVGGGSGGTEAGEVGEAVEMQRTSSLNVEKKAGASGVANGLWKQGSATLGKVLAGGIKLKGAGSAGGGGSGQGLTRLEKKQGMWRQNSMEALLGAFSRPDRRHNSGFSSQGSDAMMNVEDQGLSLLIVDTTIMPGLVLPIPADQKQSSAMLMAQPPSPAPLPDPDLGPLKELLQLLERCRLFSGSSFPVLWLVAPNTPACVRNELANAGHEGLISKPIHPSRMESLMSTAMDMKYGTSNPGIDGEKRGEEDTDRPKTPPLRWPAVSGQDASATTGRARDRAAETGLDLESFSTFSNTDEAGSSREVTPKAGSSIALRCLSAVDENSIPESLKASQNAAAAAAAPLPSPLGSYSSIDNGSEEQAATDSLSDAQTPRDTSRVGEDVGEVTSKRSLARVRRKGHLVSQGIIANLLSSGSFMREGDGGEEDQSGSNLKSPESTGGSFVKDLPMRRSKDRSSASISSSKSPNGSRSSRKRMSAGASRQRAILGSTSALKGVHILLAEDVALLQRVALLMLKKLGATVVVVGNGEEAVKALTKCNLLSGGCMPVESEEQPFDLVLMDCQMPVMDGYAATRAIRVAEQGVKQHTPIVALTANAMAGDQQKCLDAGMDGYLTKPIDSKQLIDLVHELLKLKQ